MKTQIKALTATCISCIALAALTIGICLYPVVGKIVLITLLLTAAAMVGYVLYGIFYDWFKIGRAHV